MEYPSYRYPVASLYTGSSLGNYYTFARLTADTDLQDLWSARDDQYYMGRWTIGFLIDGKKLEPRETIFRPESQETLFVSEDGSIEISKRFFIPYALDRSAQAQPSILQSCMFLIRATRAPAGRSKIVARHELHFPAGPAERFTKQPPTEQGSKQFEITERDSWFEIVTAGSGREARVLGSDAIPRNTTGTPASLLFEHELTANPGATAGMSFILAYSPEGAAAARDIYLRCTDTAALLAQSRTEYSNLLARSEILTPEPVINRGIGWAKVDSARVQHRYRTGEGFTNDPPQDIIVVRDLGWYVLGSDYFTPEFSHNLLELAERHAFHPDGKLTEFIHAGEEKPALHDYKLNINDDTPLYVYALHHHALLCGGPDAPERAYPLMKRACDYILSQEEDGLIRCHSSGTNVWGICGWRNIIEGYNLTGAVTEINVECRAALLFTADFARLLGKTEEAALYGNAAARLREAINSKLVSEKTGLYLLNLADDGTRHHDITGDLIFPVLFGAADASMEEKVLRRLTREDIWTRYGARTVSTQEHNYDPDEGYQLVGGVWPNLTAWIALCAGKEDPERLVEGMLNIYRLSECGRPADFVNVVPGEIPERLHGETFVSRGMAMSPWMPPTYVWLGVEGLMGVSASPQGLRIDPSIPPGWPWIAMRNMPYRGSFISAFVHEGTVYASAPVASSHPVLVGELLDAVADEETIICIGLNIAGNFVIFAASDRETSGTITLRHEGLEITQPVQLSGGEGKLLDFSTAEPQLAKERHK